MHLLRGDSRALLGIITKGWLGVPGLYYRNCAEARGSSLCMHSWLWVPEVLRPGFECNKGF